MNAPNGPTATIRLLIQDGTLDVVVDGDGAPAHWERRELTLGGGVNDRFLDGPACRRLAVVDFDPATGLPLPAPAAFVPAKDSRVMSGSYPTTVDRSAPQSLAINAFGTAFRTIQMFEGADALGRRVTWAFPGEQLLIVPRAGQWANAFYERETRSLQFFWFPRPDGQPVYTALSRDIVAHECGHALLDAVVPSLYNGSTPQSIAIHEAVADVIAILMALDSKKLREAVLKRTGNDLNQQNPFNRIADEFGMARPGPGGVERRALRELKNDATMTTLRRARPHELSTLLSAIFYDALAAIFQRLLDRENAAPVGRQSRTPEAAANRALGTAQIIFRRLLLRGIDYLPPGELTFADVGRATLAADEAAWFGRVQADPIRWGRTAFAQRFVDRQIVPGLASLRTRKPRELDTEPAELIDLRDSDYVAYAYVQQRRTVLRIPDGTPFTVLPRIDATKLIGPQTGPNRVAPQRELLIKVAWKQVEPSTPVAGKQERVVATGATISLHWATGRCLALVTSDVLTRPNRDDRDELLRTLEAADLLQEPDDPARGGVGLDTSGGALSLAGSHRLLHLVEWAE